jgi:hypothetical protein
VATTCPVSGVSWPGSATTTISSTWTGRCTTT